MDKQPEVVFDVARGDLGASRSLRRSLEILKSATPDPEIRRRLDDVLAGRASMREFGLSGAFASILDQVPKGAMERAAAMPEDERQRLAERGEAELARLRTLETDEETTSVAEAPPERPQPPPTVIPGTRKPNRDRVVTPDEDDEDDAYFRDRRQRGWLD